MKNLTIIRGVPGSGKTTHGVGLVNQGMADVIFEANDYFYVDGEYVFNHSNLAIAHQQCMDSTTYALHRDMNVIVANTFVSWKELLPYFELAMVMDCNIDIVDMRYDFPNIHRVPDIAVDRMRRKFINKEQVVGRYEEQFGVPFLGKYTVVGC